MKESLSTRKNYLSTSRGNEESKIVPIQFYNNIPVRSTQFVLEDSINPTSTKITTLEYIPGMDLIVFGDMAGGIGVISLIENKVINSLTIHYGKVTTVCYLYDMMCFLSGGVDGKLVLYNINILEAFDLVSQESSIKRIIYAFDGNSCLVASEKEIIIVDYRSKVSKFRINSGDTITSMVFYLKTHSIIVGQKGSIIKFYDYNLPENKETCIIEKHITKIKQLLIGGNGNLEVNNNDKVDFLFSLSKQNNKAFILIQNLLDNSIVKNIFIDTCPSLFTYLENSTHLILPCKNSFSIYNFKTSESNIRTRSSDYKGCIYLGDGNKVILWDDIGLIEIWCT